MLDNSTQSEFVRVQNFRARWLELEPFEKSVSSLSDRGKSEVLSWVLLAFWGFDDSERRKQSWSEEEKALANLDIKICGQADELIALMIKRDKLAANARGGPSVEQDLQGLLDLIGSEENPVPGGLEFPRIVDQLLPTKKEARLWEVVAAMCSFYTPAIRSRNLRAKSQWAAWIDCCVSHARRPCSDVPENFRLSDAAAAAVVTVGLNLGEDKACSESTVRSARSRGVRDS